MTNEYDKWHDELKAAGWTKKSTGLWQAPDGRLYLGPYRAWEVMRAERSGAA